MKKSLTILALLLCVTTAYAKINKPLVELEPKASLYIGSVRFGLGCDIIFNPMKSLGFRFGATELSFGDYTQFYLNHSNALDAIIYFPMRDMQPYIHAGFGFYMIDANGSNTFFSIRGGLGLTYPWSRNANLFVEPGVIIAGNGETDVWFRLSVGGRFGILK